MTLRRLRLPLALGCVLLGFSCGGSPEVITKTGADVVITDAEIDQDPLALLPADAVSLAYIDARKLFVSRFGDQLLSILEQRIPVPPGANYSPKRDLEELYIGVYSFQGADMAGVAVGNFDRDAIDKAADGITDTPLGAPLVKRKYAGRTLYVSRNIGFTVLTSRTAIFGNETGIRRALDRISDGRVKREIPKWMGNLLQTPNAAIVAGADLRDQPVVEAAAKDMQFLHGLESVRLVGNFQEPGMNVAGTASYPDEESAQRGATSLLAIRDLLASFSFLASLVGMDNPLRRLEAQPEGKESKFVAELDGAAVTQLIAQAGNLLGVRSQPKVIKANTSQGIGGPDAPPPPPPPTPAPTP